MGAGDRATRDTLRTPIMVPTLARTKTDEARAETAAARLIDRLRRCKFGDQPALSCLPLIRVELELTIEETDLLASLLELVLPARDGG